MEYLFMKMFNKAISKIPQFQDLTSNNQATVNNYENFSLKDKRHLRSSDNLKKFYSEGVNKINNCHDLLKKYHLIPSTFSDNTQAEHLKTLYIFHVAFSCYDVKELEQLCKNLLKDTSKMTINTLHKISFPNSGYFQSDSCLLTIMNLHLASRNGCMKDANDFDETVIQTTIGAFTCSTYPNLSLLELVNKPFEESVSDDLKAENNFKI